jgi:geranylgeranyl pyrophosphate synthase
MEAAFVMGAMIAAPQDVDVWSKIGLTLGLIFQIQDDVLEATTSVENMQKSKSDDILRKATFVSQSSVEEAKALIQVLTIKVDNQLSKLNLKNNAVFTMVEMIKNRTY